MATGNAGPQGGELKLGSSGKGCLSSLAATGAEESDPQHGVSADVGSISEPLPVPGCLGPSVARCAEVCTGSHGPASCRAGSALVGLHENSAVSAARYMSDRTHEGKEAWWLLGFARELLTAALPRPLPPLAPAEPQLPGVTWWK